jgi:hypothetical protein
LPRKFGAALAALVAPAALAMTAAACTDPSSSTDLHPEGPPMIEQVRMNEIAMLPNVSTPVDRIVFAFGTHPEASESEEHAVTTAKVSDNKIRIVIDELLRGNNLEEIECRGRVDSDDFARVPVGATPDDIARCSVAHDVLARKCPGSNPLSMCICQNEGGCSDGMVLTPKGDSVGILDGDDTHPSDGAADVTRFIDGAVGITCGTIVVPINLEQSYWTPSGNQQKPAEGGFNALGPAIVLVPTGSLPTSSDCGLTFSPEVVDKDGNAVCAPRDGDITQGCTPGDVSAFRFSTEVLSFLGSAPGTLKDAAQITANAALVPASIANITMTEGDPGVPFTQFTATLSNKGTGALLRNIEITATLAPNTHYTITVPTTVTDAYGRSAPEPFVLSFTTGAS